jgi:phosphate transport system substrate-binding protein
MNSRCWGAAAAVLALGAAAWAEVKVDQALPVYTQAKGVSGTVKSAGSDTMNNIMGLWAEGFRKMYPNVRAEIEGKGSATAPPALIEGTVVFGTMSREMKKEEIDAFEKKYGYKPTQVRTAIDVLAVFVHKDNPIESLTLQQVDAIFSKTRKAGYESEIKTWGDLGLSGEWADKPISLYGRNAASGTYGYFKEHALMKGDFKPSVKEQPGTSAVVQAVATDQFGVGYGGIGYLTADVKAVPIAKSSSAKPFPAQPEYAYSGEYPLSRFLLLVVNYKPGSELDPLKREFLRYTLSQQGQQDVIKEGFIPLPPKIVSDTLKTLGISASK